jgi:hypothetical protein
MAAEPRNASGRMRAAGAPRERCSALWPYLVMPLIVVVAFFALYRIHQQPHHEPAATPAAAGASTQPAQQ